MSDFFRAVWNGFNRVLDGSIFVSVDRREPPSPPPPSSFAYGQPPSPLPPPYNSYPSSSSTYPSSPPQPYDHAAEMRARGLETTASPALLFRTLSERVEVRDDELLDIVNEYVNNPGAAKFAPTDMTDLILKFQFSDSRKVAVVNAIVAAQYLETEVDPCTCRALLASLATDSAKLDMLRAVAPALGDLPESDKDSILQLLSSDASRDVAKGYLNSRPSE
eukprot:m.8704 g.8704  ORF g.8704 m.8704 type:complete len:220 (-) comp5512_c0_seq1:188-847(-)